MNKKMNKKIVKYLGLGATYLAHELLSEFQIKKNVKDTIKTKLFYTITINAAKQNTLYCQVRNHLVKNYKDKFKNLNVGQSGRDGRVLMEADSPDKKSFDYDIDYGRTIIKEHGIYILVNKDKGKEEEHTDRIIHEYRLSVLKKDSRILEGFLTELLSKVQEERIISEEITAYVFEEYWDSYKTYTPMHLDRVIIDPEIKDKIITDIDNFIARREFYLSRNLSFKRGYLFYGSPRNGKSSLIAALARKYQRDIYYLTLNSIKSEEHLMKAFRRIRKGGVLVIEDIDTVWNKRETVNRNCPITFSTFINLMSGVLEKEDILIFFTTNYYDRLDKALIGNKRIDMQVEIQHPKKKEAELYLADLYESDFELLGYQEGRSIGALFNLFEEYCEDKQGLIDYLNSEEPKVFEEPEPEIYKRTNWGSKDENSISEDIEEDGSIIEKVFFSKKKIVSLEDLQRMFDSKRSL